MIWLLTKYAITAFLVVFISEVAKRSDRLGSLLAALPMVTVLTLIWLYLEKQPAEKISNHAWYTFWYVLPTLPMFLLFPFIHRQFGFWLALGLCALLTAGLYVLLAFALSRFGINLW
ncbi:MAG: DUF3147 family protein [Gammaproteobacteria bacterium]|nr:DUF3147 family protein [Gammaproteobacteria bacterium]